MAIQYNVSLPAMEDIEAIIDYIAEDNLTAAIAFESTLYEAFELLALNPRMGHKRIELAGSETRFWVVKHTYLVVYQESLLRKDQAEKPCIDIIRVLNGYQNLLAIFQE